MAKSTPRRKARKATAATNGRSSAGKPALPKPHEYDGDFPLTPRIDGRWQKKIRGTVRYFTGTWREALEQYVQKRDAYYAGRDPDAEATGAEVVTVTEVCDRFLIEKKEKLGEGRLTQRTYDDYHATCKRIQRVFGKHKPADQLKPVDFAKLRRDISKTRGLVALGNEIQRTRSVFKYARDAELIEKAINFGPNFDKPDKRTLRIHRQKQQRANGKKMFSAAEIHTTLDAAEQPLKAMIYLAINCGFGNSDCGQLTMRDIDLESGWIDFPRPKTGVERRCPLWSETVAAIRESLETRPRPARRADSELVFLTVFGAAWHKEVSDSPISKAFAKLLVSIDQKAAEAAKKAKQPSPAPIKRPGVSFYALRHTFETIAGACRDQVAVDAVMGHIDSSMAAEYREHIDDDRLQDVVDYVHRWLFGDKADGQ